MHQNSKQQQQTMTMEINICDDDNTRETEFLVVDATFELLGIYEGLDNPQKTLRKLLQFCLATIRTS